MINLMKYIQEKAELIHKFTDIEFFISEFHIVMCFFASSSKIYL